MSADTVELDIFAEVNRLADDLDAFPESSTLNKIAIRTSDDRVIGMSMGCDPLAVAYSNGAPVELIVEAEKVAAFIGPRGAPGRKRRALALARRVRSLNARLAEWVGGRCLAELVAGGGLAARAARVLAELREAAALIAERRTDDRYEPERSLAPPLSRRSFPGLRRGPPHRAPGEVLTGCAVGLLLDTQRKVFDEPSKST